MALVHKKPVNAQFLEGDNIVLAALVVELCYFCFDTPLGFFKLLYCEALLTVCLRFNNPVHNLITLLIKKPFLTLF